VRRTPFLESPGLERNQGRRRGGGLLPSKDQQAEINTQRSTTLNRGAITRGGPDSRQRGVSELGCRHLVITSHAHRMILPPWWTNEAAARLLHPRTFVVPVVGAGLSMSAGLPGASALAEWVADRVPLDEEPPDRTHLFGVVDRIDSTQLPPPELKLMVAEYIDSLELCANDLSRALVQVPSRLIITFNYDGLLHHTAGELGIPYEVLGPREFKRAHELIVGRDWPPERLVILHLHGHTGDPDSIVLDGESYRDVYRDPLVTDILFELSHHQTLVFMATQLDESLLVAALARQTNGRDHLLLCTTDQRPELEEARLALSGPRNYITIVDYPTHDDLLAFPLALAEPEDAVPGEPAATPEPESDVLYVPADLRDRTQPVEEAELASGLFELPGSQPRLRAVSERDVETGHRTLIVGAPGTGKTELLRHVAEGASADRPALIIRMADVRIAAGDARATLAAWAGEARSVQPGVSLSAEALENRRYHFLFDGLDEVQTNLQVRAAQLVRDVAAAFPQHAFALTARPVDALAVFGADGDRDGSSEGWRVLELQPSAVWRDRYFTERRVSLDTLEAAMPILRDLRDLLSVPFFASRAIDLFQEGRLEGLTDLWDVVRELVDAQLEREGPQLMLVPEQVRAWIRSVALAALLAGRRTLSADELRLFALPGEVVGGTDQLVSILVQRLLLNERGQRYSFAHRIVGESLAAEALELLDPSDELLAAIVPRRSEALAGVRSDCLVTVGLLCSRSSAWRDAVGDRDPLAAARATPESADLAEREAAARLLWETYLERQVWMWDYDVPGLAEDSEALGRLLRSGGLDELLTEVRRAGHQGTDQDQGNAIRVLSRVNPGGFVDDLRAVLQDLTRDGVVRRQAAIAARDLGAHELLDLIVERAATTDDEAEAQDCTYIALAMARDDELLDVGRKLLPGRYGRMAAADAIARRLGPDARIAFARELGVVEEEGLDMDKRLLLDAVEELAAENPTDVGGEPAPGDARDDDTEEQTGG
jgi:SIR2-like domain